MHEGTPSPVVMLAFSGCILRIWCVCLLSCFRSTPQAGEAAGSRDANAAGRCGTDGISSVMDDGQ